MAEPAIRVPYGLTNITHRVTYVDNYWAKVCMSSLRFSVLIRHVQAAAAAQEAWARTLRSGANSSGSSKKARPNSSAKMDRHLRRSEEGWLGAAAVLDPAGEMAGNLMQLNCAEPGLQLIDLSHNLVSNNCMACSSKTVDCAEHHR